MDAPTTRVSRVGVAYAVTSYGVGGVLPLLYANFEPDDSIAIVAARVLASAAICAAALSITRDWRAVAKAAIDRRSLTLLACGAVLITANWFLYVLASVTGRVVEASLGYFINPLGTVLLGVLLLGERLGKAQWVALALGAAGVTAIAIGDGIFPWLAVGLAATFALYGLTKKIVGQQVGAIPGMAIETAIVLLPTSAALVLIPGTTGPTVNSPSGVAMLALTGSVATGSLLLFAAAARRLPLIYLGGLQYLAPALMLATSVVFLGEQMTIARWCGFGIVWIALAVFAGDALLRSRAGTGSNGRPA